MTEGHRTAVLVIAILLVGLVALQGLAGDMIGDPWWDEPANVTLPAGDDTAKVPIKPANQARERIVLQRQEFALNVLRGELSVVRTTCPNLTPEARRAIVTAGIETIDSLGNAERLRQANDVGSSVPVGPRVVAAVGRAVQKSATAPEAEAYRQEMTARAERRRAAAVAVLVEAVDQTAMLDDEERERLAAALIAKWQPFWERGTTQVGYARMTGARLPPGVAAVVADVLDPEAFKAWQERLRRLPGP